MRRTHMQAACSVAMKALTFDKARIHTARDRGLLLLAVKLLSDAIAWY